MKKARLLLADEIDMDDETKHEKFHDYLIFCNSTRCNLRRVAVLPQLQPADEIDMEDEIKHEKIHD
jgi:hypothetical protein